eukprot:TRINITY_DN11456_c0_g1_i1.p1 TRINITY_DN11456_c0_g1~~TRINITY_DN11456_c0_g1_i1.p1  ORF type:complete len:111 (-),score=23.01 TRINITY_DN11456_c0_g1_i1:65-397(-)
MKINRGRALKVFKERGSKDPTSCFFWQGFTPLLRGPVAVRVLGICISEALYMLALFKAISLISPVYVTAVKRGGGVLLSALIGVVFFGESIHRKELPLLAVATGVTFLCL